MDIPRVTINRRHRRVQELLAHVLRVVAPHLPQGERDCYPQVARELEDLFWCQGAEIVTDAMRAEAGLPIRDHNGMTMQELQILENRLIMAQLGPMPPLIFDNLEKVAQKDVKP